jgi:hypothetical protein
MHLITNFILDNTFSDINVPTNDPDDPMSIVKNTDYPDDSLLMCDQSPKVNDNILKKTVLLIQSIKYNFSFRLYIK